MSNGRESLTIDPRLLERLKGIELKSRYLVRGFYENRHRTRDFGASNEFIEHRDCLIELLASHFLQRLVRRSMRC